MHKPEEHDDGMDETEGITYLTEMGLRSSWLRRHNFVLSSERLLKENLQKRLHALVTSDPPKLGIWPLETMRLVGAPDSSFTKQLILEAGKAPRGGETNDEISAHHIVYMRLRAFFSTVAFCMIDQPKGFSLQDCEFVSDKIFSLIFQSNGGRLAPVAFFVRA